QFQAMGPAEGGTSTATILETPSRRGTQTARRRASASTAPIAVAPARRECSSASHCDDPSSRDSAERDCDSPAYHTWSPAPSPLFLSSWPGAPSDIPRGRMPGITVADPRHEERNKG